MDCKNKTGNKIFQKMGASFVKDNEISEKNIRCFLSDKRSSVTKITVFVGTRGRSEGYLKCGILGTNNVLPNMF